MANKIFFHYMETLDHSIFVSVSISFTYHLIPRGKNHLNIAHIAFADGGNQTGAACAASECAIITPLPLGRGGGGPIDSEGPFFDYSIEKGVPTGSIFTSTLCVEREEAGFEPGSSCIASSAIQAMLYDRCCSQRYLC